MAVKRLFNMREQFFDAAGNPLNGGKLFFYAAGSSTKQTTYNSSTGTNANTNPMILDANGRLQAEVWLTTGLMYKEVLTTSADTDPPVSPIWTEDNISGINDTSTVVNAWIAGPAPTYISASSFTLIGDQTSTFDVGRRLKFTVTAGTAYGTIKSAVFAAVTTVTMDMTAGALDAGLSSVFYGIDDPAAYAIPRNDTIPVAYNNADPSKKVRVDASLLTTASTRVITVPDYNIRLSNLPAGIGPLPYAGLTVPTGWLLCDGSAVSRSTYADLFTAIGTNWGTGDGSTTFNLPDLRGRMPIGDGTGTVTETITNITAAGNAVAVANNATKWITGMAVTVTGASGFVGLVNGSYFIVRASSTSIQIATTLANAQNGTVVTVTGTGNATFTTTWTARTLGQNGGEEAHAMSNTELISHVHGEQFEGGGGGTTTIQAGVNGNNSPASAGISTQSTGGNAAMNIMQPFVVTKYIISY